jgi:quinol monooxygenase YgiN
MLATLLQPDNQSFTDAEAEAFIEAVRDREGCLTWAAAR